ncbi:MAG TPA: SDR family oxidoreductase [Candidatus Hydrogenedentes bacterium]|nr:SDR family oxidoreductase [Candidatus Hydrogenedentota bacterium]
MLLKGKTALITGAGRGIGQAIAIAFAEQGCDVAITARTATELQETSSRILAFGRRTVAVPCDLTLPDTVAEMASTAQKALGPIDILVNNAGYACFKPFMELSLEEWQQTLDVNLTGVFLVTRALLPDMIARKSGRIINISSVSGLRPIMNQTVYCASKHGLNGLTTTLAMEVKPYGIRVHAICPGGVITRLSDENMPERDKTDWMLPEDIAHTALYLASMPERSTADIIYIRRFGSVPLGG